MAPASNPIELRILDDLVSAVEAINGGADYFNASVAVQLYAGAYEWNEYPNATIVADAAFTAEGDAQRMETFDWEVEIVCQARDGGASPWETGYQLRHDLEKAVKADYTRGGLAIDTRLSRYRVMPPEDEGESIVVVNLVFVIRFRTDYLDPTSL